MTDSQTNRIYVQRSISDKFIQALVEGARQLKVGNGLDEDVEIGPLINEEVLNRGAGAHRTSQESWR